VRAALPKDMSHDIPDVRRGFDEENPNAI